MSAKMLSAGLAHDKMLESIVMTSESSEENNDELKDRLANWFLTVREPRDEKLDLSYIDLEQLDMVRTKRTMGRTFLCEKAEGSPSAAPLRASPRSLRIASTAAAAWHLSLTAAVAVSLHAGTLDQGGDDRVWAIWVGKSRDRKWEHSKSLPVSDATCISEKTQLLRKTLPTVNCALLREERRPTTYSRTFQFSGVTYVRRTFIHYDDFEEQEEAERCCLSAPPWTLKLLVRFSIHLWWPGLVARRDEDLFGGRSDDELTAKIGWDYQPEKIEEYFREKPWQLAEHGAAIVQALLGLAASTAILLIQGQAWAQIRLKLAPEVRRSLCQLGPSYIKLGQALASRPDLVGGELAEELVQLQDSLPAFDTKDALEVIKQEFQGAQDPAAAQELLKSLEGAVPKAAASLGQVYQGVLRGRSVAVKVQRPEARRLAAVDAALLRSLARGVEALRNPLDGQRLVRANVLGAVDEFCSRLFEELDYRREASNCATFAALYGDHGNYASDLPPPGLKIPELEPDFCGRGEDSVAVGGRRAFGTQRRCQRGFASCGDGNFSHALAASGYGCDAHRPSWREFAEGGHVVGGQLVCFQKLARFTWTLGL
ncbi:unnamed protein product [Durusdinium trenchii]|uniref:ABC1 atypical kinase-like domain-containing protein n=1 Tax=Durusdinium trenchii TaxID=1381693 RepID=A0ABP0KRM8_9DINO